MPPGLAPLLVRGLQVEPAGSAAAAAVGERKTVLLIVAGLARHMEATWPALQQAVVVPNEQAGYTFKIVFSTNADLECHRESPNWNKRKCEEPTDQASHVDRIRHIFGARDVEVVHNDTRCGDHDGRRAVDDHDELPLDAVDELGLPLDEVDGLDIGGRSTGPVCAPWFERVHRVLAATAEGGEGFDRVVALRPDIVLRPVLGGASAEPPRLQLDKMCAEKPGFSFVTPSWQVRGRSWLHDRDLDFMHVLCPGEELPAYEEAVREPLKPCTIRTKKRPPLPPGFHSTRGWNDNALFCRFVQVFNDRNVPISHWDDDYTIDWPTDWD